MRPPACAVSNAPRQLSLLGVFDEAMHHDAGAHSVLELGRNGRHQARLARARQWAHLDGQLRALSAAALGHRRGARRRRELRVVMTAVLKILIAVFAGLVLVGLVAAVVEVFGWGRGVGFGKPWEHGVQPLEHARIHHHERDVHQVACHLRAITSAQCKMTGWSRASARAWVGEDG